MAMCRMSFFLNILNLLRNPRPFTQHIACTVVALSPAILQGKLHSDKGILYDWYHSIRCDVSNQIKAQKVFVRLQRAINPSKTNGKLLLVVDIRTLVSNCWKEIGAYIIDQIPLHLMGHNRDDLILDIVTGVLVLCLLNPFQQSRVIQFKSWTKFDSSFVPPSISCPCRQRYCKHSTIFIRHRNIDLVVNSRFMALGSFMFFEFIKCLFPVWKSSFKECLFLLGGRYQVFFDVLFCTNKT